MSNITDINAEIAALEAQRDALYVQFQTINDQLGALQALKAVLDAIEADKIAKQDVLDQVNAVP